MPDRRYSAMPDTIPQDKTIVHEGAMSPKDLIQVTTPLHSIVADYTGDQFSPEAILAADIDAGLTYGLWQAPYPLKNAFIAGKIASELPKLLQVVYPDIWKDMGEKHRRAKDLVRKHGKALHQDEINKTKEDLYRTFIMPDIIPYIK